MRHDIKRCLVLRCIYALLLLLVVAPRAALCQSKTIDSLESLLRCKAVDEEILIHQKIDILYELAYHYGNTDNKKGLRYGNEGLQLARKFGDSLRIVKAGRIKSYIYRRIDEIDSSLILSLEMLPIARINGYVDELKSILNGLAVVSLAKANYDKALTYLFESLQLRKSDGDKFQISVALHNIGLVYYKLGNRDQALAYYQDAFALKKEVANKYDLDILLINIGLCYAYDNMCAAANDYIDDGFVRCGDNCSNHLLMQGFLGYGIIRFYEEKFLEAEEQFLRSYTLSKSNMDERIQLENIIWLSEIYIRKNEISVAEKYLKEAEQIILKKSPFNLELIGIYAQFFKLYQQNKDFEKVALYQEKYISLKESVFNEELTKNLMKVEAEYLERENRTRIESQNKVLALNEEVMYRQKILNASIGAIACLVIGISLILAKNNREKRLRNKLLDEQVIERTKELEMNRDALQRAWQERDLLISKASSELQSSIATLKGLSSIGSREINHPLATEYWKQLDNTSNGLSAVLNKMIYSYKVSSSSK